MTGRDIIHVERRVLTHQDDINILGEVQLDRLTEDTRRFLHALDLCRPRPGRHPALFERHVVRAVDEQFRAARLRHLGQCKGRIAVNLDVFQRIHLDPDSQCHEIPAPVGNRAGGLEARRTGQ